MPDLCQVTGTLIGPDLRPVLAGTVTLIPEAVGYLPAALVVQGEVDGTIEGGVLTINPVIILDELTYRVAFRDLRTDGGPVKLHDFSALLPVGTVDLVDLLPTRPDGGTRVIVDGTVVAQADAAAERAELAAAQAAAANGLEYQQVIPRATWTIPHTLGRRPSVTVFDGDVEIDTDVHATATAVTVIFPEPTVGSVVLS